MATRWCWRPPQIAINPSLYSRLTYDTVKDLIAVAGGDHADGRHRQSVAARQVDPEPVRCACQPGEINVASAGLGTISPSPGAVSSTNQPN
jgi:hypothetical protein